MILPADPAGTRPAWIVPEERYAFSLGHPMAPGRVGNTVLVAEALGLLDLFDHVPAAPLDEDLLARVHDPGYIAAVRAERPDHFYGLGTEDNPVVVGMHEIAGNVVAGTVEACRQVWQGPYRRAVNIAGGLHHAMPATSSGFCTYNDIACGIRWLLENGAERVAYLDVDAHHGDGVQRIFEHDPRVLTISLHQNPLELFPGTGFATETGGPGALGSAINVALPRGTDDGGWLRAFDAVVPQALEAFGAQVLVSQQGCDSHRDDPLTDLALTVDGMKASYELIADLVDAYAGGRWVALGGGGYAVRKVVPRAWSHLLGVVAGHPVDLDTVIPEGICEQLGDDAVPTMGDLTAPLRWSSIQEGWNPASRIDQTVLTTRRAAYPELGLDPEF